jgi:hypothetical protein
MKLAKKVRIGAKRKRKYEPAKTPFRRLIESKQTIKATKDQLQGLYQTLNPAALKRTIDQKIDFLYQVYRAKRQGKSKYILKKEATFGQVLVDKTIPCFGQVS